MLATNQALKGRNMSARGNARIVANSLNPYGTNPLSTDILIRLPHSDVQ